MSSRKNEIVTDSVHGTVQLESIERQLIKTPTFNRLANVKALGLAYHVFPGATHTRFSHSIGTMHVSGKIAERLGLSPQDRQFLRLACLLHDVGQYPLSHVVESVYRVLKADESSSLLKSQGAIAPRPLLRRAAKLPPGMDVVKDKALARTVLTCRPDIMEVFADNGFDDSYVIDLADAIAGNHVSTLWGHLLDSDFDCDRLDYVSRDSHCCGVTYGMIELDYLVHNMSVVADGGANHLLAVSHRHALHALEHYLMARYFLYSQVIYHKTVRSLEVLAKAAYLGLADRGIGVYPTFEKVQEAVPKDEFLLFDDSYFHNHLRAYWSGSNSTDELHRIIERVLLRHPLSLVREFRCLFKGDRPEEYSLPYYLLTRDDELDELCAEADLSPSEVVVEELSCELIPIGADMQTHKLLEMDPKTIRSVVRSPRLKRGNDVLFLFEDRGSLLFDLAAKDLHLLRLYTLSTDVKKRSALEKALWRKLPAASRH